MIRVSGRAAFELVAPHVAARDDRPAAPADLQLDDLALPVIVLRFVGPRSYTAEDIVEIQVPGHPVLIGRVIEGLLVSGRRRGLAVRLAEPGEFTARAYFNGRLSLTEAEGVAATIAARSDAQLRAASLLRRGRLGGFAHELADDLAGALALVEAGIDFTDQEDVVPIDPATLRARIGGVGKRIANLLERSVAMEQLEAIPWVVLRGRPNAGKSSLFNALLDRERAVVSGHAGTTRDVLTEPLALGSGTVRSEVLLTDLAGFDEAHGELDRRVQSAARSALQRAELVVRCVPVNEPTTSTAPLELLVRTKCDLGEPDDAGGLPVSARDGTGLDALRDAIAARLGDRAVSLAAETTALQPRHDAALRAAARHLAEADELVAPAADLPTLIEPALVAATMRLALDDLAGLAGDITPDDVLGKIFATFCIGK